MAFLFERELLFQKERLSDVDVDIKLAVRPEACSAGDGHGDASSSWSSEVDDAAVVSGATARAHDVPIGLERFPGHMAILSRSEYFASQAPLITDSGSQTPSKPVLHLTIEDASHLAAAKAVIATLYGVKDSVSTLEPCQLAHVIHYARMMQQESVAHTASDLQQLTSTPTTNAATEETAIDILLQHYAAKIDQRLICSIAMVCKEWNTAVQHAKTGVLEIKYRPKLAAVTGHSTEDHMVDTSLLSLTTTWLPKYAQLVGKVDIMGGRLRSLEQFRIVSVPLLQLSLQAAAGQGMQLRSLNTDVLYNSTFLRALSCTSLTQLQLTHCYGAELAAALPRLEQLEKLHLFDGMKGALDIVDCLPAMQRLSKLTSLELDGTGEFNTCQLPTQLRRLKLRPWDWEYQQFAAMDHLSCLTSLKLCGSDVIRGLEHAALPSQLLRFNVDVDIVCPDGVSATEAFRLTNLGQLESLRLHHPRETTTELLQLAELPQLQKLSLNVSNSKRTFLAGFSTSASAWPQIRQLQDLRLWSCTPDPVAEWQNVLGHIAACTGLTRVKLRAFVDLPAQPIDLCQYISSLHRLQELTVHLTSDATYWSGQARYLRQLTRLTMLELRLAGAHFGEVYVDDTWSDSQDELESDSESLNSDLVDAASEDETLSSVSKHLYDAAVIVSLLQLKQLQWLSVSVSSIAVLPAIGSLRELRYLDICGLPSEADSWAGLMCLSDLKKLTKLRGFWKCSENVILQFWDAVRA